MLETATYKLTNGDLFGMDVGELREHLGHYLYRREGRPDSYARGVAGRIAYQFAGGITEERILAITLAEVKAVL